MISLACKLIHILECFCGSSLTPAQAALQTGCNMACSGNSAQICGGGNRLSVYNYTQYIPTQHQKQITVSSSAGKATYNFQGCIQDGGARALAAYSITSNSMTEAVCANACFGAGYAFAGMEYASECWCANSVGSTGIAAPESDCNMTCSGSNREWCGGPNRLSLYKRA